MCETIFYFDGDFYKIQCKKEEKFKEICKRFIIKINTEENKVYYVYNGNIIQNKELTFDEMANPEDKTRNIMNILVNAYEPEEAYNIRDNFLIRSKNIICPECKEDIKFDIDGYNISLLGCKNKHEIDNIYFDKFEQTQMINISQIICDDCKIYNKGNVHNNIFFRCNKCNMNLCPICSIKHDKNHSLINYDEKNYLCEEHNKSFIAYCEDCRKNICMFCEKSHDGHYIINLGKLIPDSAQLKSLLKEFEQKINLLKNDVDKIIERINKFYKNIEYCYNLNKNLINNFEKEKINYEILHNINNIKINDIIKDINEIINNDNILSKFKKINNIYEKMNSINTLSLLYETKKSNSLILFGQTFVEKNKNICKIIIDGKEHKLSGTFKLNNNYNDNTLKVKLKGINKITNISGMFILCNSLLSMPDISKWNTSNITDMSYLFWNCDTLKSLPDISNFDTSNVTNMSKIFCSCKSLISLPDISKWDISNLTDISYMFHECNSLSSLPDISKWNTSNITDISFIFYECCSLISLPDISKWNTHNISNMSNIFRNCVSLKSLPDISIWNTSNVINMSYMFNNCELLKSLPDISKWNTFSVTNMNFMFCFCRALISIPDINKWNLSNLKENEDMFKGCNNLKKKPKIKKSK